MVAASPPPTYAFGPVQVQGWRVEGQFGGRERGALVQLSRGRAKIVGLTPVTLASVRRRAAFGEYHLYGAHGRRVQTTTRSVVVSLGLDGGVALNFHPRGAPRRRPRPSACRGTPMRVQPGRLTGSLTIVTALTGMPILHISSLPGARVLRPARLKCRSGPSRLADIQPETQGAGPDVDLDRTPHEARISVSLFRDPAPSHPVKVTHLLIGLLPRSALAIAPDLSRATFTSSGPFSGSATFAAPNPGRRFANGTLTGPLTATFTGLGPISVLGADPIAAQLSAGSG